MNDESQQDERYDEAAIRKMADLWGLMYTALLDHGVPPEAAVEIVKTWIKATLGHAKK